ncbi:MAG: chemotaxis protein CheA [Deltaproteobacteria bacterium]|nr:chemotaxis protein CheA [Deltaproteobacteria bacterium]MCL5891835.1 chemotaxis protein CheA [Deltaproteobacteria bacterium]
MIDDSMKEIVNDFVQEALELLESLNENFVELEKDPGNKDLLNTIFRAAHTIKGSAGFLGFQSIVELAHSAENILNKLRQGEIFLTPNMMDCLLGAMDILKAMIVSVSETGMEGLSPVDNTELIKRLDDMAERIIGLREEELKQLEAKGTQAVRQNLPHSAAENGKALVEKFDAAGEIINGEKHKENRAKTDKRKVRNLGDILLEDNLISKEELEQIYKEKEKEIKQPETETFEQKQERNRQAVPIQEVPKPPQTEAALPGPKPSPARTPEIKETTIRVDIDRLDNVMNLVGELVLARNRLFNISSKLEMKYAGDDLSSALAQVISNLNLVTTDLQLAVMKTRMQPVKKVFSKFPRMVRDLSRELGKEIELQILGEETELDKSVIEEIGDPLVHLIRNSVDHGVETKEMRKRLGKPETGTIKLSAEHEGNYIVISVSDDGKGMDPDILKKKAVEKGVIDEKTAFGLSDKDALSLIFTPGFSTKEKATEISGRGVGMDVVKTNIQKINGIIDIESQIGHGSKIVLKLPLTVAIIQTLIVGAGEDIFAIPLNSVVETLRISESSIQTIDKHEVINLRKSVLSLLRLGEEFGIKESNIVDLNTSLKKEIYVVVVALAEKKIGVVVDNLYGQEEVVIKSLGDYQLGYKGISGATITGDGKVVLIIDIASMIESAAIR